MRVGENERLGGYEWNVIFGFFSLNPRALGQNCHENLVGRMKVVKVSVEIYK